jgi:DNA-binding transcriptional LysR family regulator
VSPGSINFSHTPFDGPAVAFVYDDASIRTWPVPDDDRKNDYSLDRLKKSTRSAAMSPATILRHTETQERALLDGRIAVGILVLLSNRPILELLRVQLLIRHPVTVALPKSHPQAVLPEIRLPVLKEEPFIGLNRMYPEYSNWLQTVCQQGGFKPRIAREADGAASALALVGAGFGVALVSEPIKKFPARHVVFKDLVAPKPVKIPLGAIWKKNGLYSGVVSKFVATLSEVCAATV